MAAPKFPKHSPLRQRARLMRKQGYTFVEIGRALGVTQQRAFQLVELTIGELKQNLKDEAKKQAQDLRKEIGWDD